MADRMWVGAHQTFVDPLCGRCGHLASVHHWTGARFTYCSTWAPDPCWCGRYRPDDLEDVAP